MREREGKSVKVNAGRREFKDGLTLCWCHHFTCHLSLCLQVRKRAAGGVVEVLASLQPHPSALSAASDALARMATGVLAGPEVGGWGGYNRQTGQGAVCAALRVFRCLCQGMGDGCAMSRACLHTCCQAAGCPQG